MDKCYLKMPKGDRYVYRKKKKGKAFTGVQRYEKKAKEIAPDDAENSAEISRSSSSTDKCSSGDQPCSSEPQSASRRKMRPRSSSSSRTESSDDENAVEGGGYRLIDLKRLSSTLSVAHVCNGGKNSQ